MAIVKRTESRRRIHKRIRKVVKGTAERPRLAVSFSGQHIYAQVIDDTTGRTLAAVATTEKDLRSKPTTRANVATAVEVGKILAERAKATNVNRVVFDRGGFRYAGKVKALADAARESGLEF